MNFFIICRSNQNPKNNDRSLNQSIAFKKKEEEKSELPSWDTGIDRHLSEMKYITPIPHAADL